MTDAFDKAVRATIAIAAIVVALSTIRTSLIAGSTRGRGERAEYVPFKEWSDALKVGIQSGDSAAPVTVLAFADFECPACASFHGVLRAVQDSLPGAFQLVHVHYPLSYHKSAYTAAKAAECAATIGRFEMMSEALYRLQDSLGVWSWGRMAQAAGIRDTALIVKCMNDNSRLERIDAGRSLGDRVKVRGTPTIVINGKRFFGTPQYARLKEIGENVLANKDPFMTKR